MKRSKFSLSNYKLLSCDMGELVPIGLTEVLPGDSVQQATSALIRVSPLLAPVMHPVHVRIHHWYVPHRIVWEDWEDFITGGPDGMNEAIFPTISMPAEGGAPIGSLADYLGVPTGVNSLEVSALPFRAYALIYNEWYRDQDLTDPLDISIESGVDTTTSTDLVHTDWDKDYFTSSRPWTQKGPEVVLPLGGDAPVVPSSAFAQPSFQRSSGGPAGLSVRGSDAGANAGGLSINSWTTSVENAYWGDPQLVTDLAEASAASVNDLRLALALQRYEEARARYGSRYTEYLRYLGVRSSDARLQRPEYLGGGKQTIQFSEVLQTAEGSDPVGELRGHGIGALRTNRYRRFFEEHGYIITCISVKPKTIYAQGLPRTWNRRVKEDFWQKELEHIGQQEVLNKELYAPHATPNGVFGYQDRYDEYRRTESTIAGEFRDQLDFWHYARIFDTAPALNSDFVRSVPTKRTNAVQTEDVLWIMAQHSIQARRLVAKTGKSFIY